MNNQQLVVKTLSQLQGVVHVECYLYCSSSSACTVIVFTDDGTIDATVNSPADLDELADVVDSFVTQSLVETKVKINYRITI